MINLYKKKQLCTGYRIWRKKNQELIEKCSRENPKDRKERQEREKSIHQKRCLEYTELRAKNSEEMIEKYGTEGPEKKL